MRDKRRLEGIIEIGDESEVVDGHETDQLQVLDEDPGGEESNTTDSQGDELGQDENNEDPVHGLGGISESLHDIILKVKDHLETDLLLLNSKLVGGGVSEPQASVISLVVDINMESVTFLDKKTNSVRLRELHGEVNGHTVLVEVSNSEVLKLLVLLRLSVGGISPVDAEELVEVLLEPGHVNGAGELEGTFALFINISDVVKDSGGTVLGATSHVVSGFISLGLDGIDANSGVERVLDRVRVLLLDDNGKVVSLATINLGVRLESDRVRGIVEKEELGVLVILLIHVANVHFRDIVTLRIDDSWKLILVDIVDFNVETSLWVSHEIWIVVRDNFNVEVHFEELVETIARADDGLLDADFVISVGLDINGVLLSVVDGNIAGILTTLVDDIGAAAEKRNSGSRVLLVDIVLQGVLTTVVLDTGEVLGGESARSGDLHRVEKGEAARVSRGVRSEPVVLGSVLDQSVLLGEGVEAISLDSVAGMVDHVSGESGLVRQVEEKTVIGPSEVVLVDIGVGE